MAREAMIALKVEWLAAQHSYLHAQPKMLESPERTHGESRPTCEASRVSQGQQHVSTSTR